MNEPFPIAVLLSGGGTTLQNLLDQIALGTLPVRIVQVIASKRDVPGIARAKRANLPVEVIERRAYTSFAAFSVANFDCLRSTPAQLICLAGYLQLLQIPEDYAGRVINIHPSLLPAFGGKRMYGRYVHEAVLEYGAKISGCTVHFADNEFDHGPIIAQESVTVEENDTPETLAERVFAAECRVYPAVIRAFAAGRVQVVGRKVRLG